MNFENELNLRWNYKLICDNGHYELGQHPEERGKNVFSLDIGAALVLYDGLHGENKHNERFGGASC